MRNAPPPDPDAAQRRLIRMRRNAPRPLRTVIPPAIAATPRARQPSSRAGLCRNAPRPLHRHSRAGLCRNAPRPLRTVIPHAITATPRPLRTVIPAEAGIQASLPVLAPCTLPGGEGLLNGGGSAKA